MPMPTGRSDAPHTYKALNWFFTAKGHDELVYDESKFKYVRYAKESGSNAEQPYLHLQGFCGMKTQSTRTAVKKALNRNDIHLEPVRGRLTDCERYCTKENAFCHKFGEVPKTRKAAASSRWEDAWQQCKDSKGVDVLEETDPQFFILHAAKFQSALNRTIKVTRHNNDLHEHNWWIYGRAGTGKSRLIHETWPENEVYLKRPNKWWCRYNMEPMVLLDDIPMKWCGLDQMKNWGDRYPFDPEVKNGSCGKIRPLHIAVTSQYRISEMEMCIHDPELREALERRYKEVDITQVDVEATHAAKRIIMKGEPRRTVGEALGMPKPVAAVKPKRRQLPPNSPDPESDSDVTDAGSQAGSQNLFGPSDDESDHDQPGPSYRAPNLPLQTVRAEDVDLLLPSSDEE